MLTYMDTVTLLVTLFVMILSFATFDPKKYSAFTEGLDLSKYGSSILFGSMGIARGQLSVNVPERPVSAEPDPNGPSPDVNTAQDRFNGLKEQLDRQGLGEDVSLKIREGVIEMEISDNVLFSTASAELTEKGITVLGKLAGMLKAHSGGIVVEGHTDDRPIKTEQFPSNWELSGARASSVARHLIAGGVPGSGIRIVGYADNKPVAGNDTARGRQRNRRVNIVLETKIAGDG